MRPLSQLTVRRTVPRSGSAGPVRTLSTRRSAVAIRVYVLVTVSLVVWPAIAVTVLFGGSNAVLTAIPGTAPSLSSTARHVVPAGRSAANGVAGPESPAGMSNTTTRSSHDNRRGTGPRLAPARPAHG